MMRLSNPIDVTSAREVTRHNKTPMFQNFSSNLLVDTSHMYFLRSRLLFCRLCVRILDVSWLQTALILASSRGKFQTISFILFKTNRTNLEFYKIPAIIMAKKEIYHCESHHRLWSTRLGEFLCSPILKNRHGRVIICQRSLECENVYSSDISNCLFFLIFRGTQRDTT